MRQPPPGAASQDLWGNSLWIAVGLLAPAQRTDAGHRLYGAEEVVRLQKVVLLRQLGFSLEEIRACLDQPDYSLYRVIQLHLARLKQQIDLQQQIYRRLETIAGHLQAEQEISVEEFTGGLTAARA